MIDPRYIALQGIASEIQPAAVATQGFIVLEIPAVVVRTGKSLGGGKKRSDEERHRLPRREEPRLSREALEEEDLTSVLTLFLNLL